jgi:histone H3/H4
VWLDKPGAPVVLEANVRRLARSAIKWRRVSGLAIEEADLLAIESTARELITLAQ